MHFYQKIFLFLAFSLLAACSTNQDSPRKTSKYESLFDAKIFFESEVERLESADFHISKTVRLNGEVESLTLEQPNFELELSSFIKANINKPAWLDKYEVSRVIIDTITAPLVTTYTALDEELSIRKVEVARKNEKIVSVFIEKSTNNMMTNSVQELSYYTDRYQIKSIRNPIGGTTDTLFISGTWINAKH